MKIRILSLVLLFVIPAITFGQKKVKAQDVIGTWKLVITMDKEDLDDEDVREDREVDGSFLGHVISSGVLALVTNILDDIDIRFEFKKDGYLEVTAMGETEDNDDNRWFINSAGELIIKDEDDRDRDDDDIWLMVDGKLQAFEKRGSRIKEKNVYLERVGNK